ncbi:XkdX family protein [Chengkuizengella sp. SCS-71B]
MSSLVLTVQVFVERTKITEEQYEQIVGEPYTV